MLDIKRVHFTDFFKQKQIPIVSLDISVNSTGWVICLPYETPNVFFGIHEIPKNCRVSNNLIRKDFKDFILSLFSLIPSTFTQSEVYIESVFSGINPETVKTLTRLNSVVEDLIMDGLIENISIDNIKKISNQTWKSTLRDLSGYKPVIKGENAKVTVQGCLSELGLRECFNSMQNENRHKYLLNGVELYTDLAYSKKDIVFPQDVWDAFGIAIHGIYKGAQSDVREYKLPKLSSMRVAVFDNENNYNLAVVQKQEKGFTFIDLGNINNMLKQWNETRYTLSQDKKRKIVVGMKASPMILGAAAFYPNFKIETFKDLNKDYWFVLSK